MIRFLLALLMSLPLLLSGSPFTAEAAEEAEYALPSRLASRTLLLGSARAADRVVAVGQWGHVILSDDSGATWQQAQKVPTRMTLTDVSFASAKEGWAVGHDMVILHTTDRGETWEMQYSDPEFEAPLLSVYFESKTRGFATGNFGSLFVTEDGGVTWNPRTVDPEGEDPHFNSIFPGPQGALFIAAEMGIGYRSDDGGETWTLLEIPYEGSFWGGLTLRDDTVLFFGMRGHIFRSADRGESWTEVVVDSEDHQSLSDGIQLENGRVVLGGLGGSVVYGSADGASYRGTNLKHRRGIASVVEAPNGDVLLFGAFGVEQAPN